MVTENIWKAAKYARTVETAVQAPELVVGDARYKSDEQKAGILIDTFSPTPPRPEEMRPPDRNGTSGEMIEWPELTLQEVEAGIFKSNQDKAPGPDEITFRVWRELWPVVGPSLLRLYRASLDLGHVPGR